MTKVSFTLTGSINEFNNIKDELVKYNKHVSILWNCKIIKNIQITSDK